MVGGESSSGDDVGPVSSKNFITHFSAVKLPMAYLLEKSSGEGEEKVKAILPLVGVLKDGRKVKLELATEEDHPVMRNIFNDIVEEGEFFLGERNRANRNSNRNDVPSAQASGRGRIQGVLPQPLYVCIA